MLGVLQLEVVVEEHPVAGVVEHEYSVPFEVRYSVIAELKQIPLESIVCHPEPYWVGQSVEVVVVEVVQYPAPPLGGVYQYWPEGQVVEEGVPERCWQTVVV